MARQGDPIARRPPAIAPQPDPPNLQATTQSAVLRPTTIIPKSIYTGQMMCELRCCAIFQILMSAELKLFHCSCALVCRSCSYETDARQVEIPRQSRSRASPPTHFSFPRFPTKVYCIISPKRLMFACMTKSKL